MKSRVITRLALIAMICLTAAVLGCRGPQAPASSREQVKVEVGSLGIDQQTGKHYVLLRDRDGRSLPIMIGDDEARAILLSMNGVRMQRPLTSQLLSIIINRTGNHVDRVVVSELRDQTYYAYLELDDGRYRIDCRPSDAIALAMDTDAPIYVSERLLQNAAAGSAPLGKFPPTRQALGLTVQELTPELAGYFAAAPSSGLLVVEVSGPAAAAGVSRGDIMTRVDGKAVTSLGGFGAAVAKLKQGAPITMLVRHAGVERSISFRMPPAPGASRAESSRPG
ncbi:MAG TPA: bifunctional nuclease domain-containing protein [Candidatus Binataceae bacterium]|nr:bifunctional nuclease domain-containing protein [Candidatus Binataceae bacterium]